MRLTGYIALVALSLGVAGYALVAYGLLPIGATVHPEMRPAFEANRLAIYIHVFAAVFAMALGPFQFSTRLRAARLGLHRWMGRLYLGIGVLAGGISGLYIAFFAHGGAVAKAGFACLALGWLYTGLRAYLAIRARDIVAHRRWMVRNFALTFAAVTLRLYLPLPFIAGVEFESAYRAIAWLCWVPNLILAELLFNRTSAGRESPG
jgi:uncharacterized membrane protein